MKGLSREALKVERLIEAGLAPNDAFLIEQVVDDFDAIAHLRLRAFRHWDYGSYNFAWFDIVERGNSVTGTSFELLSVACHVGLPSGSVQAQQILRHAIKPIHFWRTVSIAYRPSPSGHRDTTS